MENIKLVRRKNVDLRKQYNGPKYLGRGYRFYIKCKGGWIYLGKFKKLIDISDNFGGLSASSLSHMLRGKNTSYSKFLKLEQLDESERPKRLLDMKFDEDDDFKYDVGDEIVDIEIEDVENKEANFFGKGYRFYIKCKGGYIYLGKFKTMVEISETYGSLSSSSLSHMLRGVKTSYSKFLKIEKLDDEDDKDDNFKYSVGNFIRDEDGVDVENKKNEANFFGKGYRFYIKSKNGWIYLGKFKTMVDISENFGCLSPSLLSCLLRGKKTSYSKIFKIEQVYEKERPERLLDDEDDKDDEDDDFKFNIGDFIRDDVDIEIKKNEEISVC